VNGAWAKEKKKKFNHLTDGCNRGFQHGIEVCIILKSAGGKTDLPSKRGNKRQKSISGKEFLGTRRGGGLEKTGGKTFGKEAFVNPGSLRVYVQ